MSLFHCEPTLSGVRIREELEKLVYGRPAHDAAMPTGEADGRRYPRDRENFCVCRQRWSSIRRRAIDWARCAASRSPSAAAMIDPFIRMCHA
jgi:hypothetical protein